MSRIRAVVLGGYYAGKTALLERFVDHQYDFDTRRAPTPGVGFCTTTAYVDDEPVRFQLFDTNGHDRFRTIYLHYYKNAEATVVVYDVTNRYGHSFDEAKAWVEEIQEMANPNIVIALVGCKADLSSERVVKYEEAKSYAEDNGLLFMEVSAKTGMNVDELFSAIGSHVLKAKISAARLRLEIQIDKKGKQILNLARRGLFRLPDAVSELNELKVLDLSFNKLRGLSESIGDLVNLTQLFLNGNRLSSLPASIKRLKKLQELDLSNNKLKGIFKDIVDLKHLKRLCVEGNPLKFEDMRSLIELTNKNLSLLMDIAVVAPSEIQAQGRKAKLLYEEAVKDGFVNVYRGRVLIIGQDRAGKTSLRKNLLGLPFDPKEQSTEGIEVDPSKCEIDVDQVRNWHSTRENKAGLSRFSGDISRVVAEKRFHSILSDSGVTFEKELPRKESIAESQYNLDVESNAESGNVAELVVDSEARSQAMDKVAGDADTIQVETKNGLDDVPEDGRTSRSKESELMIDLTSLPEDVIRHANECLKDMLLRGKQAVSNANEQESMVSVDVWDFAGQHLYYASHPVFLSSRAVYILVHNLSKPLNAPAEPCVRQGTHDVILENPNGETNLENLLSWLVAVHRMKPKEDEVAGNTEGKLPYLRPPVFIVGTHADKPFEEIKTVKSKIQQEISGREYESHVIRPLFSVDNTQGKKSLLRLIKGKLSGQDTQRKQQQGGDPDITGGDGIDALRAKIMEVLRQEPYMGEKIPVRWLHFQKVIEALVARNIYHSNVVQLQTFAREICFIEDEDEFHTMLNFYHDLGFIVRHQSTVVLNAQWLIGLFRHLITIPRFDEVEPLHSKCWQEVESSGLLSMELVDHVFSKFIQQSVPKEDILDMMVQFGLIAKFSYTATDAEYFVPCQLKSSPEDLYKQEPSMLDPCPLYLQFVDGFVPHGLFTRLVSRSISWCCETWRTPLPNLYQNGAWFVLIEKQMIYDFFLLCNKSFIKIVLKQRRQDEVVSVETPVAVARRVRVFLEDSLQNLSQELPYLSGLQYELCIACPYCQHKCPNHGQVSCTDENCLHFLEVKEEEQLICMKSVCDKVYTVHGVEMWFSRTSQELDTLQGAATQSLPRCSGKALKVTLLASEWSSSMGGLSTINRKLAILLAQHTHVEVTFLVPEFACGEEDKITAGRHNIIIREAQRRPGYNDPLDWLSFPPRDLDTDIVVGHGAKLGKQAQVIKEAHACKWAQVVHTAPEELGMYKNYPRAIAKGEEKNRAEVDLCKLADLVVTVGPKLAEAYSSYLRSCKKHQDIFQLTPGTFHEFSTTEQVAHEGNRFKVLTFGRGDAEDFSLKGYDIAAKAVAELKDSSYCLVFVGAPDGKQEEVATNLLLSGISKDQLIVRTFVQSKERLNDLFCEVDLAIMPSRTEGFGLTALEALSAGLPILVSGNSGFGAALRDLPSGESFVVESEDPEEWAKAIASVRQKGRAQRLGDIQTLRTSYEEKYSWEDQCKALIEEMMSIVCESQHR